MEAQAVCVRSHGVMHGKMYYFVFHFTHWHSLLVAVVTRDSTFIGDISLVHLH